MKPYALFGRKPEPAPVMVYGKILVLVVEDCSLDVITSRHALAFFAGELVELLGMKAYGPPEIVHFGHGDPITSGYSLKQWIETSSIIGHFSDHLRRAHLTVFSCRDFDEATAAEFCAGYFRGRVSASDVLTC